MIKAPTNLHSYIKVGPPLGESFHIVFERFLSASGLTDPQVYGSRNMGRDTFWRIRNKKNASINKKNSSSIVFWFEIKL